MAPGLSCRGKRRFRDMQEAKESLRRIAAAPRAHAPVRWYFCQRCRGYHLTKRV